MNQILFKNGNDIFAQSRQVRKGIPLHLGSNQDLKIFLASFAPLRETPLSIILLVPA